MDEKYVKIIIQFTGLIGVVISGYVLYDNFTNRATFSDIHAINYVEAPITKDHVGTLDQYESSLRGYEYDSIILKQDNQVEVSFKGKSLLVSLTEDKFIITFDNLSASACKDLLKKRDGECNLEKSSFYYLLPTKKAPQKRG